MESNIQFLSSVSNFHYIRGRGDRRRGKRSVKKYDRKTRRLHRKRKLLRIPRNPVQTVHPIAWREGGVCSASRQRAHCFHSSPRDGSHTTRRDGACDGCGRWYGSYCGTTCKTTRLSCGGNVLQWREVWVFEVHRVRPRNQLQGMLTKDHSGIVSVRFSDILTPFRKKAHL